MVIYNVTVNVEPDIEQEWIDWMKIVHIPDVLETGYFDSHKFLKLLTEVPDATGSTYAVQYKTTSLDRLNAYTDKESARLQHEVLERFPGKFVAFRTVLEEI
jgi:hypothetical protein